jgi:hypothetical protein
MTLTKKSNRWEIHFSLTDPASGWKSVLAWCWETLGHPGTDPKTGVKSSWDYHGGWIYFYDEKCVTMYMLKWPCKTISLDIK